jgi:hypothetical protein
MDGWQIVYIDNIGTEWVATGEDVNRIRMGERFKCQLWYSGDSENLWSIRMWSTSQEINVDLYKMRKIKTKKELIKDRKLWKKIGLIK